MYLSVHVYQTSKQTLVIVCLTDLKRIGRLTGSNKTNQTNSLFNHCLVTTLRVGNPYSTVVL